jgi:hypothetical protein
MVLSMLAREPAARMPGMPILVRELRRLEEGRGLESAASLVPDAQWFAHMRERAFRPQRSAWSQAVLFAGLALGIGLAGFIHFWPAAGDGIAAARSPAKQVSSGVLSIPEPTPPKPIAAEPAPLPVAEKATAKLTLVVSPRGEIYVNGKHHGTTPPITTLDLEPGMHRIEVRNGSRKPYLTYMTVKAGDRRRIRHEFGHAPRGAR